MRFAPPTGGGYGVLDGFAPGSQDDRTKRLGVDFGGCQSPATGLARLPGQLWPARSSLTFFITAKASAR